MTMRYCVLAALWMLAAASADGGEWVVTSRDFTEPSFPWQAPSKAHRLDGPLRIVGCAGEYEPVTFTVHPPADAGETRLTVTGPEGWRFDPFWVKCLQRERLGVAAFINDLPGLPGKWKSVSPELLIPFARERPTLTAGLGQRFYVDCPIPSDAAPGTYRATLRLLAGGREALALPLEVRVLPFALAAAPSTYWMWRLTWSPIDRPENLACLRDIAAHGYTGLARKMGASFDVGFEGDAIRVRPGTMPAFARALRETGLAPRFADDQIAGRILRAVAKHLDLPVKDVPRELPTLADAILAEKQRRAGRAAAEASLNAGGSSPARPGPALKGDADAADLAALRAAAEREAAETHARIRPLAVEGFRQVKAICKDLGVTLHVFPVDEPCGTPWQRRWTAYAAGLARRAGLETWSTRNNWDWQANLDHGAAGAMINAMYRPPALAEVACPGVPAFDPLPWIGAHRQAPKYHFRGCIDDVRIYHRALTRDEVLAQHRTPAPGPAAHFPCDGPPDNAALVGGPAFVPGRVGKALKLNGVDQHLVPAGEGPADLSDGWAISLWYRGRGSLFGKGYDIYQQQGRIRYTTTKVKRVWADYEGHESDRFWCHLTVSFDPGAGVLRAYCADAELRRWHRENIRWNYVQVRSFPPWNPRYKTGVMSWWYATHGALDNVTTFCYDWNASYLYVVYPAGGERFANDGVWHRTLGWEACREGIDDARYLQTLLEALRMRGGLGEAEALRRVERLLEPVRGSYRGIAGVREAFGGYPAMRQRVINEILKLRKAP